MPRTALQWASLDNDALGVHRLLGSGENANADDWVRVYSPSSWCFAPATLRYRLIRAPCVQSGRTALHYACKKGHTTVVRLLLAAKADTTCKDKVRWPIPATVVARMPRYSGATADAAQAGDTPEQLAVRNKREQVVAIMDDFKWHRLTLVWVSQKVAWLGIGHPRLGSTSPAKDLDPRLWAAIVGRVSQEQAKYPPTSAAICCFFYRGTLSLQQGFAWRSSQLTTRQATKPPAASDSSLSTPGTATAAKEVAEDAQDNENEPGLEPEPEQLVCWDAASVPQRDALIKRDRRMERLQTVWFDQTGALGEPASPNAPTLLELPLPMLLQIMAFLGARDLCHLRLASAEIWRSGGLVQTGARAAVKQLLSTGEVDLPRSFSWERSEHTALEILWMMGEAPFTQVGDGLCVVGYFPGAVGKVLCSCPGRIDNCALALCGAHIMTGGIHAAEFRLANYTLGSAELWHFGITAEPEDVVYESSNHAGQQPQSWYLNTQTGEIQSSVHAYVQGVVAGRHLDNMHADRLFVAVLQLDLRGLIPVLQVIIDGEEVARCQLCRAPQRNSESQTQRGTAQPEDGLQPHLGQSLGSLVLDDVAELVANLETEVQTEQSVDNSLYRQNVTPAKVPIYRGRTQATRFCWFAEHVRAERFSAVDTTSPMSIRVVDRLRQQPILTKLTGSNVRSKAGCSTPPEEGLSDQATADAQEEARRLQEAFCEGNGMFAPPSTLESSDGSNLCSAADQWFQMHESPQLYTCSQILAKEATASHPSETSQHEIITGQTSRARPGCGDTGAFNRFNELSRCFRLEASLRPHEVLGTCSSDESMAACHASHQLALQSYLPKDNVKVCDPCDIAGHNFGDDDLTNPMSTAEYSAVSSPLRLKEAFCESNRMFAPPSTLEL